MIIFVFIIFIVSAFSAVAASGGYYVALDSDFIFANPGSVVGSIGVIMSYPILEEMLSSKTGFWLVLFLFKKSTFCSKSVLIYQKEYFF